MMPTTAKTCGQYLNSILAVHDSLDRGFEEALLLDTDGFVAEGSGENVFLIKDGQIFTNDERRSILLGVTRDAVIKIAGDLGYSVGTQAIADYAELAGDSSLLFAQSPKDLSHQPGPLLLQSCHIAS